MPIELGTRLGPYEILMPLGAGGMGEVYEAKDTRLDRTVAIKVLPEHLSEDPALRERFEREARAVSSLNHPHICTLHDVGEHDGIHFLVMELVEGESLADRLKKGALPFEQAIDYAAQIADALAVAHREGIVHRDLKPGNVMLTRSGVKLLDFGLAKTREDKIAPTEDSEQPTQNKPLTGEGTILGTVQYMAPEQLEGKDVDARADLFAVGAILFEMVTGRKAFEGESQASLISAIMSTEPPPASTLQSLSPPSLDRLVEKCLAKDPEDRWQTARDLGDELRWLHGGGRSEIPSTDPRAKRFGFDSIRMVLVGATGLLAGAILTLWFAGNLGSPPAPRIVTRAGIASETLSFAGRHAVALSADGTRLVYSANNQLYLHAMDQFEATPIRGTNSGARNPFFSPDGESIGFYSLGVLRKVSIDGGTPVTLCNAGNPFGASWGPDGTIFFSQGAGGIQRVSENGGTPEVAVAVDPSKGEVAQGPQMLPGGSYLLFTLRAGSSWDEARILARSLETGEERVLIEGGADARYVSTGHLVYARESTIFAVPFDVERLEVTGGAVPVVEGVMRSSSGTGAAQFSLSETGTLVFAPDTARSGRLIWVDRNGVVAPLPAPARTYEGPRLSPDGSRLAFIDRGDIWLHDIPRNATTRLTFTGDTNHHGWTSRGERVFFSATRSGLEQLYWMPADGTGAAEPLTDGFDLAQHAESSSIDGRWLAFRVEVEDGGDVWVVPLPTPSSQSGLSEADRKPRPLLDGPYNEEWAAFSPDGRWLAYASDETGRDEVYVQPFPGPGAKLRVSSDGGDSPAWARSGRELFYLNGTAMMVVPITIEGGLEAGSPKVLFEHEALGRRGPGVTYYDVTPDGERFIMVMPDNESNELRLVLNWFEELKRLVPVE